MARRLVFAGAEHQRREIHAVDVHHGPGISYYGDGRYVMAVCKRPKRQRAWAEVIGENGRNIHSEAFVYSDYFTVVENLSSENAHG